MAGPGTLPTLRQSLDESQFGVTALPSGPAGPSSPILQVDGIMVNANSEALLDNAVAFARFMSLPENQAILNPTLNFL